MTVHSLTEMAEVLQSVENTLGKEIARYKQFLLFSQCFKRLLLHTHKNQGFFGRELNLSAKSHDLFKPVQSIQDQYLGRNILPHNRMTCHV